MDAAAIQILGKFLVDLTLNGYSEQLSKNAMLELTKVGAPPGVLSEVARLIAVASYDAAIKEHNGGEQDFALLKAVRAMLVAEAKPEEIFPLEEMRRAIGRRGRKPRKMGSPMATFAAAVTALKKGRRVDDVIAEVATPNGISRKELKNFRDRLNRGLINDGEELIYRLMLIAFQRMKRGEIMSILPAVVSEFVPNSPFLDTCP